MYKTVNLIILMEYWQLVAHQFDQLSLNWFDEFWFKLNRISFLEFWSVKQISTCNYWESGGILLHWKKTERNAEKIFGKISQSRGVELLDIPAVRDILTRDYCGAWGQHSNNNRRGGFYCPIEIMINSELNAKYPQNYDKEILLKGKVCIG